MRSTELPLQGIRVVEVAHMIMGPSVGLILADLGADVIKIEPPVVGDKTRQLTGSGIGFFPMFGRNKRSISVDITTEEGQGVVHRLLSTADVFVENFRPGAMEANQLGYADLTEINPRLVYCSLKGFLSGPYENRLALDEVVQMMGGLAYMTGPPGRPLRAGASVNDVMGGMFAVIGILAALREREATDKGKYVKSALFENNVFLVGQHMAQYALTGDEPQPMPNRLSAWAIYDVFEVAGGEQVFLAVVSDGQWKRFGQEFGLEDLTNDPSLSSNEARVRARDTILPKVANAVAALDQEEVLRRCEAASVPYAPVTKPSELYADPQLNESPGAMQYVVDPNGAEVGVPGLPLELNGARLPAGKNPPKCGEHTVDLCRELGYSEGEIDTLLERHILYSQ